MAFIGSATVIHTSDSPHGKYTLCCRIRLLINMYRTSMALPTMTDMVPSSSPCHRRNQPVCSTKTQSEFIIYPTLLHLGQVLSENAAIIHQASPGVWLDGVCQPFPRMASLPTTTSFSKRDCSERFINLQHRVLHRLIVSLTKSE